MADAAIEKEIADTQAAIEAVTGKAPGWFWAPFLEHDERVDAAVRRASGLEHDARRSAKARRWTNHRFGPEGVVAAGALWAVRLQWPKVTSENLEWVIHELRKQGVEFVTFSELAGK